MRKLQLEVWNSDNNRQERHYFLNDGNSHAYQQAEYFFGINPDIITPEVEEAILDLLSDWGYEWDR